MGLSALFGAGPPFKASVNRLVSLSGGEVAQVKECLRSLEAPFGRSELEALAHDLTQRVNRTSEKEWREDLRMLFQILNDPDFVSFLAQTGVVSDREKERLDALRGEIESERKIARVLAMDQFVEQGPRLKRLSWFCDLRTKFAADGKSSTPDSDPVEEFTVPMCIIRVQTDEFEFPVTFELVQRELSDLIVTLQKAQRQLVYVATFWRKMQRSEPLFSHSHQ